MKSWTRATLVLAATALVATGCGRDESGGPSADASATAVAEGKAEGAIQVWAMGTEGEKLGAFAKAFQEENPDATVEVTAVPWEAAHDKIATAIAAGETPDVSLVGTTWMGEFARTGGLDPTPPELVDESAFFEGAWASTLVDDVSYGVPWYVETRVLYYRSDMAQKAGWDEPPKSWEELTQFAEDMKSKGGAKYGLNLQPGQTGAWQTFMPFAWSNGATMTNEDATEYTIDSPETVEALEYYKSFFDAGLSKETTLQPGELEQGFAKGEYAAFISGPWHMGLVEDAGVKPDQYDVAPLPSKDGGDMGTSFVGGGDLAVFKDSDNRDAAWKFVQWLSEPEVQQAWYDEIGDLPSVRSAWESGKLSEDAKLAVFGEQLDSTQSPPTTPTWEQVAAAIDSDIEKAVKGAMPVPDAVADMQQKATSIGMGT